MRPIAKTLFSAKTNTGNSEYVNTKGHWIYTLEVKVTAVGATPTCTVFLEGTNDPAGTNWESMGSVTITTATSNWIHSGNATTFFPLYNFVRARVSANTNCTLSAFLYCAGFAGVA